MEPMYHIARNVLVPLLRLLFRWRLIGVEKIPRRGPAIIAPNHVSNFDPLCTAYLVDRAGRRPRFLAKASLWKVWFLRLVLGGAGQIPVERGTGKTEPLEAATNALARGEVVVLYPEGTITRNPDLTPMAAKNGIARLALRSGAPVYPVGMWGPQWYIAKYHRSSWRPWRVMMMKVGDPLTFHEPSERREDPQVLREIADRVMGEIDRLVREVQKIHPEGAAIPPLKEQSHG